MLLKAPDSSSFSRNSVSAERSNSPACPPSRARRGGFGGKSSSLIRFAIGLEHHAPLDLHYYIGRQSEMYEARQGNGSRRALRPILGWAVLLGLAATAGCAEKENTVRLEVYSWWNQEAERAAFDAVVNIHQQKYENVEIRNLVNPDSGDSRTELAQRMLAEAPPATFQANLGADMLQWAVVDTVEDPRAHVDAGPDASKRLISDLSELYARRARRQAATRNRRAAPRERGNRSLRGAHQHPPTERPLLQQDKARRVRRPGFSDAREPLPHRSERLPASVFHWRRPARPLDAHASRARSHFRRLGGTRRLQGRFFSR